MATAGISISSQGAKEYRELAVKVRKAARKDLRAALRKKITEAGRPVLDDVKAAVRDLPVSGSRGGGGKQRRTFAKTKAARRRSGLRSTIASATRLQITAKGVRFIVSSDRLPVDQRRLPRHLDSPKGWRHPIFGDRHTWVHQAGKPYFAVTIKRRALHFRRAVIEAMEEIKRELEG